MEANIVLSKCLKSKKLFGVRVQKMSDGDWWRTWAFKISEQEANKEGYQRTPIRGNMNGTDEYPGCPYCGTHGFVQCGSCKKIFCWNGEEQMTCPWCGNKITSVSEATDGFELSGGDY